MINSEFTDPRGEYKRVCPYCFEPFIADHMSRIYCESQNGKKDFCKNRYKRLVKELRECGIELDRPERPPVKFIFDKPAEGFINIDEKIKKDIIHKNVKVFEKLLNGAYSNEFMIENILKEKVILEVHDGLKDNVYGTKSPTYGSFMLVFLTTQKVRLINNNKNHE